MAEIFILILLITISMGMWALVSLAWMILKALGELQYRINNPLVKVDYDMETDHGKDQD